MNRSTDWIRRVALLAGVLSVALVPVSRKAATRVRAACLDRRRRDEGSSARRLVEGSRSSA